MSRFFYIAHLLSLLVVFTANAEVILKYDFDRGYNVDNVSGTIATEGSADDIKNNLGLLPFGLKNPALVPGKQVDPLRAFAVVESGKALLTGVDKKTGNRIDYSVKLPKVLSEQQGAISFYITPVDWSGAEVGKFHNFVALYSGRSRRSLDFACFVGLVVSARCFVPRPVRFHGFSPFFEHRPNYILHPCRWDCF